MKILMIVERIPCRIGGGIRQFGLIRELAGKHEFTVACFAYPVDLAHMDDLRPYVRQMEVVALPQPAMPQRSAWYWRWNAWRHMLFDPYPRRGRYPAMAELRQRIHRLTVEEHFDLVHVNQAYLAHLRPISVRSGLLDMQDILSEYERLAFRRQTKSTYRFAAWLEWKKTQALERRAVRGFDLCTVATEDDRSRLTSIVPGVRVEVVPNGVDLNYFRPSQPPAEGADLIFVGSMDYAANVDAVLYFHREILPLIHQERPDARFHIVGYGPPPEVLALHDGQRTIVTGYVEDVRPYLERAVVSVIPLRIGSGIRNKILEAWAMSKAVVSTCLGAEGLPVLDHRNILLADDATTFSQYVLRLLADPALRMSLGQAGRALVETRFSWPSIAGQMEAIYQACMEPRE